LAEKEAWFTPKLVGENAARDGLPLELPSLVCPALPVDIGVKPRRGVFRGFPPCPTDCEGLVLLAPVDDVGSAVLCKEGSWEVEEGKLIDVARTFGTAGSLAERR